MINIQDIIPFMKKGWVAIDEYDITIAEHRTYEQMIKIIEGLLD